MAATFLGTTGNWGIPNDQPGILITDLSFDFSNQEKTVLDTSESKPVPAMPHTARVKLDVHLFSQVDDTPAEDHAEWAGKLVTLLRDTAAIQADLDSETFVLHDLIEREGSTTPDESRGRESVLSYEAVVSAV